MKIFTKDICPFEMAKTGLFGPGFSLSSQKGLIFYISLL